MVAKLGAAAAASAGSNLSAVTFQLRPIITQLPGPTGSLVRMMTYCPSSSMRKRGFQQNPGRSRD